MVLQDGEGAQIAKGAGGGARRIHAGEQGRVIVQIDLEGGERAHRAGGHHVQGDYVTHLSIDVRRRQIEPGSLAPQGDDRQGLLDADAHGAALIVLRLGSNELAGHVGAQPRGEIGHQRAGGVAHLHIV
jgi:hypothetical protein